MRYFYEKPQEYTTKYGKKHFCNHPVYTDCTLYSDGRRGLAVIQQRYSPVTKHTWWTAIDPWLIDDIFCQKGFKKYFEGHSGPSEMGIYPTVTVRQVMWALKMKPLKRERWESVFDHTRI